MASLEFSREPCLTVTGEPGEWTDDDDGALHPLSAAEGYARRLNRTCLYDCTEARNVQPPSIRPKRTKVLAEYYIILSISILQYIMMLLTIYHNFAKIIHIGSTNYGFRRVS